MNFFIQRYHIMGYFKQYSPQGRMPRAQFVAISYILMLYKNLIGEIIALFENSWTKLNYVFFCYITVYFKFIINSLIINWFRYHMNKHIKDFSIKMALIKFKLSNRYLLYFAYSIGNSTK